MWELLDAGEKVIFEGAQGAMLDIDHGTYPFVTSSNPLAGRRLRRRGRRARRTSTRSGGSPRPTRRASAPGRSRASCTTRWASRSAERGGEFGTTTGRPRRTGWLDLVALRYAARLNTLTALAITKLDVLSGFDRIQVCTSYRGAEGAEFDDFPYHQSVLHHADRRADRAARAGGRTSASAARSPTCPRRARDYLRFIAEHVGAPGHAVGVGPGREQTIWTDAGNATLIADQRSASNGSSPTDSPARALVLRPRARRSRSSRAGARTGSRLRRRDLSSCVRGRLSGSQRDRRARLVCWLSPLPGVRSACG